MKHVIANFFLALLALGAAAVLPPIARGEVLPPRDLLALGGEQAYWVVEVAPVQREDGTALETRLRMRQLGAAERWRRLNPMTARAVALAERGTELALLLENGQWLLVWSEGSRRGASAIPGRGIALAGDAVALWALSVLPPEEETVGGGRLGLHELERGQWVERSVLQLENVPAPQDVAFSVAGGAATVVVASDAGGELVLRTFRWSAEDDWREASPVTPTQRPVMIGLVRSVHGLLLWSAGASGPGETRYWREGWGEPTALASGADERVVEAHGGRALTEAARVVRLLFVHEGEVLEQRLEADGSATDAPAELTLPRPAPEPTVRYWINMLVLAVLVLVMVATIRRRRVLAETIAHADELRLAPLGARFLAGTVDASPILLALMVVAARLGPPEHAAEQMMETAFWLPIVLAAAVYLLHTTVLEVLTDRSIGKMLFGLRVVGLDGKPTSRGAVLMRNVLRIVDLYLLFPLVLVLFSPLRQRIGDIAAATLVVREPAKSEKSDDGKEKDEEAVRGRYD
jgi:uncharacterized RDD family membrane protein YckC